MSTHPTDRRAVVTEEEAAGVEAPVLRRGPPTPEPAPAPAHVPKKDEDRIPLIWRLSFGGLLSLVALVSITLYHQLNSGLANLRGDMNNLNVKSGNTVSKDEFNTRML